MTDSAPGTARPPARHEPAASVRRVVVACLAIMSVATAVIHFTVAGEHFRQYWLFGVFMLVTAWLQLLWAVIAMARPARLLLWTGAILNTGVVAVYIVTRTIGDVVGPAPHSVEPLGFQDGLCTVLEAIVVAGCAWLLIARADRRVRRHRLVLVPATTGAATAILLSAALVASGPEMVMSASGSSVAGGSAAGSTRGMRMSGLQTSPIRLATQTPAGDITMPDTGMVMPGMKMAGSAACDAAPTKDQQKAAVSLVNASWKDASKYRSLAVARAAGYQPITPVGMPVVHYINVSSYLATMTGGPVLNTAKPQSLVYVNTSRGAVLAAAMYITSPGGATPQPGGCLTQWHVHTNLCQRRGLGGVVGLVSPAHPTCPAGSANRVTPPMMHVWFVPVPGGPTAIDASAAQLVHAAGQVAAPANGTA